MRRFVMLLIGALLALMPPAAAAAQPEMGSFDNGYESFVDTEFCAAFGFDVTATEHEYGSYQVFRDGSGEFTRLLVHLNYDAWISANGKTLVERDTWTFIGTPDSARNVGLTVQIKGADGMVQLDAGQIVFGADGSIEYVRGPHPQALGETFCPALVP
ncbi:MAG TPA: hypothetical protein VFV72_05675 [Candidatus Limnocylindrales bacterium]|nr:hypothetical protein [Candidatus Limnocylindrales bacterium]